MNCDVVKEHSSILPWSKFLSKYWNETLSNCQSQFLLKVNKALAVIVSIQHPSQKGWPGTFGSRLPDG